jgi:hypothetical protein
LAELINLRTVRKRKARAVAAQQADANREKYGQSKLVKNQQQVELLREKEHLDGHKLNVVAKPEQDENTK